MARTMAKVAPLHADLIPPQGSEEAGYTHDGKHKLYKLVQTMNEPKPVLDEQGNRVYKKNARGENTNIAERKPHIVTRTRLFYLERDDHNNVNIIDYRFPTPEEIEAQKQAALVKQFGGGALAEALVKAGITSPDQIVERLTAKPSEPSVQELKDAGVPSGEPQPFGELVHGGGPNWTLGNGEKFRGSRVEAEAAQAEARAKHEAAELEF